MTAAMSYHVVRTGGYVPINGKPVRVPDMDWRDRYRYRHAWRYGVYCDACGWGRLCVPADGEREADALGRAHVKRSHPKEILSGAMYLDPELAVRFGLRETAAPNPEAAVHTTNTRRPRS